MNLVNRLAILFLLSFLTSSLVQAQNTLDLSSSAGFSFRLAKAGTAGKKLNKKDDSALAYRFGAAYSLKIGPKTYLSTGIQYGSLASKRKFDADDFTWGTQWNGNEFDPSIPSGEGSIPSFTLVNRKHLVEIPLSLRIYLTAQKRFYLHAGLTPSIHLRYVVIRKEKGQDREITQDRITDFQSFQLAANAGVGMDWPLTEKLNIFTQLNGQFHLLEEVKDSGLRWWDVSLQTGIRIGI